MNRLLLRTTLLAASLPLLGGCVAAIVPVVASSALVGNSQLKSDDKDRDPVVTVEQGTAATTPAETIALAAPDTPPPAGLGNVDGTETSETSLATAELPTTIPSDPDNQLPVTSRPSPDFIGPIDSEQEMPALAEAAATSTAAIAEGVAEPTTPAAEPVELGAIAVSTTPPPAPSASTLQQLPRSASDFRAYDALYSYVDSQARRDPVESPRQSAILAAPGTLSPTRTECSIRPPAVLIDLDPGERTFDTDITPQPNPALGQVLGSLRLQEVEIFWISRQSAISAGAVRNALIASKLDPQGRDSLLLMRNADDRKQARRKELSETHCLLAIGGDTRADFDELYLYLKEPSAAQPLEELIGAGWFLTPLPLAALSPQTESQ